MRTAKELLKAGMIAAVVLGFSGALHHEYRVNEVIGSEHMLPHHSAREVVMSHASHTYRGKVAIDIHDCLQPPFLINVLTLNQCPMQFSGNFFPNSKSYQ